MDESVEYELVAERFKLVSQNFWIEVEFSLINGHEYNIIGSSKNLVDLVPHIKTILKNRPLFNILFQLNEVMAKNHDILDITNAKQSGKRRNYKEKFCISCKEKYIPTSSRQEVCSNCKTKNHDKLTYRKD